MNHIYFKTKILGGHKSYWMKRDHPEHPCHQPHIGDVYCLYGKEDNWGYAIFNVIKLSGVTIVWSRYHINKRITCKTQIDQPLLELGFILRQGGSIKLNGKQPLTLSQWQMNFSFEPYLKCKTTLERHYIETLDFYPEVSFLERFSGKFKDIVVPYLEAVEHGRPYNMLDYSPYIYSKYIQNRLLNLKKFIQRKNSLSKLEHFHLLESVMELFEETFVEIRGLIYPGLTEKQKAAFDRFETDPVKPFEMLPTEDMAARLTLMNRHKLNRLCRERHYLTLKGLVAKAWLKVAAQKMLTDEDESIESIALSLGWGSVGVFSAQFRLFMGESPSAFRARRLKRKPDKETGI